MHQAPAMAILQAPEVLMGDKANEKADVFRCVDYSGRAHSAFCGRGVLRAACGIPLWHM